MRIPLFTLLAALLLASAPGGGAAEFDLDSGRVVLRQLQYCLDCGSTLLVTGVRPGVPVRCPDCGREQARLAPQYLLTQMYQMCKICQGPLNPAGRRPGEVVECGNCHARQPLGRDVFARGENADGLGYVPGFPPGTGKKKLLFSPNRPDGQIAVVPLPDAPPAIPFGYSGGGIPAPPAAARRREDAPPPPSAAADASREAAVAVPVVTADLFGGGQNAPAAGRKGRLSAGAVAARVNGAPVYAVDVDRVAGPIMRRLRQHAGPADAPAVAAREKSLRAEVLERLIDRELVMREAEALGHRPDPAEVRARETELAQILAGSGADVRNEAVRDVTMADMRRRYAEKPGAATPAAVRDFYAKHKDETIRPRLVALDQLVIYEDRGGGADARSAREIALEISRRLEGGERFDDLRDRHDEFLPRAGLPRREPELLPAGAYAGQVVAAGGELRRGAVFGPLFLPGMALFGKVADERPGGPAPFEEVEGEIRRRLEEEATERNLSAWLKRLRARAEIEYPEEP